MATADKPVAILTGAAGGVGAAIAFELARRGWNLLVNYRSSEEQAAKTGSALRAEGADVLLVQGDVALEENCLALVAAAEQRWQRIDALVNNAAVTTPCPAEQLDGLHAEDFQKIMGVNVVGAYQMTRACVSRLRESPHASVVNISSQAAFSGLGSSIAYAASKAALNTMTLSLARALAPAIRVNAVCPGFVNTRWVSDAMDADAFRRFRAEVETMTPLGRMAEASDVAEVVAFLVTCRAPLTGELIGVDGGNHLTVNAPGWDRP